MQEALKWHGSSEKPISNYEVQLKLWLYHNVNYERKKPISSLRIEWLFVQTRVHFTKGCFVPSLVEIGLAVLEKKIFKCGFPISLLSPFGKGNCPSFEQTWTCFPRNALSEILLKLADWPWRRTRLLNLINVFLLFHYNLPFEMAWPYIWTNFIKGWNWPSGSGEEDEHVKVYRWLYRRTDDRWTGKLTWASNSG